MLRDKEADGEVGLSSGVIMTEFFEAEPGRTIGRKGGLRCGNLGHQGAVMTLMGLDIETKLAKGLVGTDEGLDIGGIMTAEG